MSHNGRREGEIMEEKEREIRIKELIKARNKADELLETLNYHKNKRPKHNTRPLEIRDYNRDSPFTMAIQTSPRPDLEIPDFPTYDGEGDPYRHVSYLETLIRMSGFDDAMLCKIFAASLTDSAISWFGKLRSGSISSFTQFKQEFLFRFEDFCKKCKSVYSLANIKQGPTESLRSYMKRWKDATHEIAQMDIVEAKYYLRTGVHQHGDYYKKLMPYPPNTLDEMYVIADRCIAMEDALGDRRNWDNRKKWRKRKRWGNMKK